MVVCFIGIVQVCDNLRMEKVGDSLSKRFRQQATKVRKDYYTCELIKEVVYVSNYKSNIYLPLQITKQ